MIEIKEGIDLDRVIAGVIGLICTQRVLGSDIEFYADPRSGTNDIPRTFRPSVNLIDAFRAAEVIGLFDDIHRVLRKDSDGTWEIADILASSDVILTSEATPALAICAAILKTIQEGHTTT